MLDPLADKLLICTMFGCLTYASVISWPITFVIFTRDLILLLGAGYYRYQALKAPKSMGKFFSPSTKSIQVHPTLLSKWNTTFQLLLIATALTQTAFPSTNYPIFLETLSYLTLCTTVASGIQYATSDKVIEQISTSNESKF